MVFDVDVVYENQLLPVFCSYFLDTSHGSYLLHPRFFLGAAGAAQQCFAGAAAKAAAGADPLPGAAAYVK